MLKNTTALFSKKVDSSGSFSFKISRRNLKSNYSLSVYANECLLINETIKVSNDSFFYNINDSIDLKINKFFGLECFTEIHPITYEFDSYKLNSNSLLILNKLIFLMKVNLDLNIDIGSHTDCIGNRKYNFQLSKLRSESVKDYLIMNGIDSNRLVIFNFGETKPIQK